MKLYRFFSSILTVIFRLCTFKRTHLACLLYHPDYYAFTPTPKRQGCVGIAPLEAFVVGITMSFIAHFYLIDSLCRIAQQNISLN